MTKPKTPVTTQSDIVRSWHLVDLKERILGRAATEISALLVGKHKPYYAPNLDCGDWVIAINAQSVRLSGAKALKKKYAWHTGYPGGFRETTFAQLLAKSPRRVIELAVAGMLPKNKLRTPRLRRLKVYANDKHPYTEQLKQGHG